MKCLGQMRKFFSIGIISALSNALRSRSFVLIPFRAIRVSISGNAMSGGGRLTIGSTWPGVPRQRGYFTIQKRGRCVVEGSFSIHSGCKIYVGEGACLTLGAGYANANLKITCSKRIYIGAGVAIADNVLIQDGDHHEISGGRGSILPIKIGDNTWIGANVIILKGVTIGKGAVVGAGSVVTRDVPDETLVAGNPARVIRSVKWS